MSSPSEVAQEILQEGVLIKPAASIPSSTNLAVGQASMQAVPEPNLTKLYDDQDISTYVDAYVQKKLGGYFDVKSIYLLRNKCMSFELPSGMKITNGVYIAITPAIDLDNVEYISTFSPDDKKGFSSINLSYHLDKSTRPVDTQIEILQDILNISKENWNLQKIQEKLEQLTTAEMKLEIIHDIVDRYKDNTGIIRQQLETLFIKLRHSNSDVFEELMPQLIKEKNNYATIIFSYNITQSHWLVGEIVLHKIDNNYMVDIYTHDPYGKGKLSTYNFNELRATIIKQIKLYHPAANINLDNFNRNESLYPRRQKVNDQKSCGVITANDMIKRSQGLSLRLSKPHKLYAKKLRKNQLLFINNCEQLPPGVRKAFMERNSTKVHTLPLMIMPTYIKNRESNFAAEIDTIINRFHNVAFQERIINALGDKKTFLDDIMSYKVAILSVMTDFPLILLNTNKPLDEHDIHLIKKLYYFFLSAFSDNDKNLQELLEKYYTRLITVLDKQQLVHTSQKITTSAETTSTAHSKQLKKQHSLAIRRLKPVSDQSLALQKEETPDVKTKYAATQKQHKYNFYGAIKNINNYKDLLIMGLAAAINMLLAAKNPYVTLGISLSSTGLTLWNEYVVSKRQYQRLNHYEKELKEKSKTKSRSSVLVTSELIFYSSLLIGLVALVYYVGATIAGNLSSGAGKASFLTQALIMINIATILPLLARKFHVACAKYYADEAEMLYVNGVAIDREAAKEVKLLKDELAEAAKLEEENELLRKVNEERTEQLKNMENKQQKLREEYRVQERKYSEYVYQLNAEKEKNSKLLTEAQKSLELTEKYKAEIDKLQKENTALIEKNKNYNAQQISAAANAQATQHAPVTSSAKPVAKQAFYQPGVTATTPVASSLSLVLQESYFHQNPSSGGV